MSELVVDEHLGGYVAGGDDATFYPDLWRWLVDVLEVKSVIDVGCGEGHAVDFFHDRDCAVLGIDGIAQEHPAIAAHDYTRGVFPAQPTRHADLVWCCEFVEHVEERYLPNFLETFKLGRRVLLTHAEPGQQGYHHVNCQPRDYWVGALAAAGFELDEQLTLQTRALARLNPSPWNHYVRSGLAFKNVRSAA